MRSKYMLHRDIFNVKIQFDTYKNNFEHFHYFHYMNPLMHFHVHRKASNFIRIRNMCEIS